MLTDVSRLSFASQGLEVAPKLNGKGYKDLPPKLQRIFMAYMVSCRVLYNDADDAGVYEAFLRMNTGSENLSKQEIRHVLFWYAHTT